MLGSSDDAGTKSSVGLLPHRALESILTSSRKILDIFKVNLCFKVHDFE